jgi:anti-sigma factor ChrR (cupin superfamily)
MIHIKNIFDTKDWVTAEGYPKGTKIKTLRDENGAKSILLKLPKNFHMVAHTHIFNEQHMVLRGEYKSEGKVYQKGSYRLIHAHQNHGPFTSKSGAVILVIWDPIK